MIVNSHGLYSIPKVSLLSHFFLLENNSWSQRKILCNEIPCVQTEMYRYTFLVGHGSLLFVRFTLFLLKKVFYGLMLFLKALQLIDNTVNLSYQVKLLVGDYLDHFLMLLSF